MEKWQLFYLIILAAGLIVGRLLSPILAVFLIWVMIISSELVRYWREVREFEEKAAEAKLSKR
ncbi:hypothetical protein AKJ50_00680 [candidate division MSBL1 archaeon SCGC-AAA382A13]|uniref:Uncharacterized protein n=1 Tax=candidate division MSBL1 archaeon SCGC-AAA382A13 TaxID=1698279 RepID=A0A133VGG1_9EURY|nr:hypothetical protein AKJ50_00680 [candidate division MSBL1 archaeon SCGC-AAA382A13]